MYDLTSGLLPADAPRYVSVQGFVDDPGPSHLYGQLRLGSVPRQLEPWLRDRFFLHMRSDDCVYLKPASNYISHPDLRLL